MGSSVGEAEIGGIDEAVGGLVWVRRRNGSWWPGQIVSVDDLPKSCLLAAKPGTPVKLLGRDDASVDWYNLNKSKRVKGFRCGEFDNCIEKAKVAVNTTKKSVKYARREDAIICALEIEHSYDSKHKNSSRLSNSDKKESGDVSADSLVASEIEKGGDELSAPLKDQELARGSLSSADQNEMGVARSPSLKGKRPKTPNDSEDDGVVWVKRMRGIKDLVFDVASQIKDEVDGESNQLNQENVDEGNSVLSASPANSGKSNTPSLKKKHSYVANGGGHESKRRRDRRRTLTKVLEESVMVSVPITCDKHSSAVGSHLMVASDWEAAPESMGSEGTSSDFAKNCIKGADAQYEKVLLSNRFGSAVACDDHQHNENRGGECLLPFDSGAVNDLYEVPLSVDDDNAGSTLTVQTGSSGKMQMDCTKQCQRSEEIENKPVTNGDVPDPDSTNSAAAREGISYEIINSSSMWQSKRKRNSRRTTNHKKIDLKNIEGALNNGCSVQGSELKIDFKHEKIAGNPEDGLPNWGNRASHREIIGAHDEAKSPTRSLLYRHSRLLVPPKYEEADFPPRHTQSEPIVAEHCLHNIKVDVISTYRSHHVPIVSFMSKFIGKAIVGHPLTVEMVVNGYSDKLLKQLTDNISCKHSRKPRSIEGRDSRKHSKTRNGSKKGWYKNGGSSSKKTKKLSALTGSRRSGNDERNPLVEKLMSSAISCIPLNVVFSRLNEAVNGSKQHHFRTMSKP